MNSDDVAPKNKAGSSDIIGCSEEVRITSSEGTLVLTTPVVSAVEIVGKNERGDEFLFHVISKCLKNIFSSDINLSEIENPEKALKAYLVLEVPKGFISEEVRMAVSCVGGAYIAYSDKPIDDELNKYATLIEEVGE